MTPRLLLGLMLVAATARAETTTQITQDWCSPAVANTQGNVTIKCNGVDPKALARLNELLDKKDLELEEKIAQANEWARRYQELLTTAADDPQLQELIRNGELEQALARQLAAQAQLAMSQNPALLPRSILLSIEFMRRFPTFEAEQTLRSGVSLLPSRLSRLHHEDQVLEAVFSPDSSHIATRIIDHHRVGLPLRVWDTQSGEEIVRLEDEEHRDRWVSIAFSTDGNKLLAATPGHAAVWDTQSYNQITRMTHDGASWGFSQDQPSSTRQARGWFPCGAMKLPFGI